MYLRSNFLKPVLLAFTPVAIIVLFLTLSRAGFFGWQFERIQETGEYSFIFLQGLRFDLVLLGIAMAIPVALTPLFTISLKVFSYWRIIFLTYATLWFVFIAFMELSTPSFINQFDTRPNYIFVEYLEHYEEVGKTLLAEYPLQLLFALIAVPLFSLYFIRLNRRLLVLEKPVKWLPAILLVPLIFVSMFALGRSSLGHRPANPSTVAITTDHLVNELALSSAYTVLYAMNSVSLDEQGGVPYGDMPFPQVLDIVKNEMRIAPADFTSEQYPTRHVQRSTSTPQRPPNIVIVLEESLGAEFVGSMGGLPLTPNLDRLAKEGIWFSNLYATGTRSVRGIEAVISGFLPTPGRSVVKLNKSQREFFTLAGFLKDKGYDTGFIYGGESHFDNMRSFFMGNGFNYAIDQYDYPETAFMATWGVSDEDLFTMADKKFSSYGEQPFFALVFTSTNHSPFEFPDQRIELYDDEKYTVNNAVKYADYALGEFIGKARQSNYWDNTLFLIISDHNSRVYGSSLVPIERFHIPGLILGGGIKPDIIETLTSQIDIGPTLLSLAGLSGEHPMVGRDMTLPENRNGTGRAIMQFNSTLAYREGDEVIIWQQNAEPRLFNYVEKELVESASLNYTLVDKALAHSLFAQIAYRDKLYQ